MGGGCLGIRDLNSLSAVLVFIFVILLNNIIFRVFVGNSNETFTLLPF